MTWGELKRWAAANEIGDAAQIVVPEDPTGPRRGVLTHFSGFASVPDSERVRNLGRFHFRRDDGFAPPESMVDAVVLWPVT